MRILGRLRVRPSGNNQEPFGISFVDLALKKNSFPNERGGPEERGIGDDTYEQIAEELEVTEATEASSSGEGRW